MRDTRGAQSLIRQSEAEGASGPAAADLRLVFPAITAWAGAAAAPLLGPGASLRIALVIGALGVVGAVITWRTATSLPSPGAASWLPAAVAVLLCGAAALAGTALRADSRTHGPLADLAKERAAVRAELILTGDPIRQPGRSGRADLVVVSARTVQITGRGKSWLVRQPVLVLAQNSDWLRLLPGCQVGTNGRLQPARDGDVAAVLLVSGRPAQTRSPPTLQRAAGALREVMREAAGRLGERERGLLPALVDGDVSRLDADVSAEFRAAGLSHLTAVSGANCAIVLAVVMGTARRVRLGRWPAAALGLLALGFFVLLARPSPSVLRASIMGALGVVALAVGRTRAAVPALASSVLVLVLIDPGLARSPGFALSVAATAGIVILAPGWQANLRRKLPATLADAISVAAAAQVACTPVLAAMGSTVSLVAVPVNLLAAPAVAPATVLGLVAAGAQLVWPPLSAVPTQMAGLACRWLIGVAHLSAGVGAGRLPLPDGTAGFLIAVVAMASLLFVLRRRRTRRPVVAVVAGLLVASVTLVPVLHLKWPPQGWQFVACDVGQGDALIVNAGEGRYALVDAGPDPALLRTCLSQLDIGSLALIVITHNHADHVEGLPGVLGRMPIGAISVGPLPEPALEWDRVRRWASRAGVGIRPLAAGTVFALGQSTWQVVGPRTLLHGTDSDPNNASLVLRVQLPGLSLLLTGDAEQPLQDQLLAGGPLNADVLKVPHHGSDRQDAAFLAKVQARAAVVSVGAGNSYGHPSQHTVDLLTREGAAIFRTDIDGSIAMFRARSGMISVVPHGGRDDPARAAGPARTSDRTLTAARARLRPARAPPGRRVSGQAPRSCRQGPVRQSLGGAWTSFGTRLVTVWCRAAGERPPTRSVRLQGHARGG